MVRSDPNLPPSLDPLEEIRLRILDGRIGAGERLIEERLAADLGVSRTPVREALIVLNAQGQVHRTRRGWRASTYSQSMLDDAFELRATIEGLAAYQAATRATPQDLDLIEVAYNTTKQAVQDSLVAEHPNWDLLSETNSRFHHSVLLASHNRWLESALAPVLALPLVLNASIRDTPESRIRVDLLHSWIVEAIVARDGERAKRLMLEHIVAARALVRESSGQGGRRLLQSPKGA
jgi:DNA-binding GntR family transcriptional regulator